MIDPMQKKTQLRFVKKARLKVLHMRLFLSFGGGFVGGGAQGRSGGCKKP
jgi:hypothetical protein